MNLKYTPAHSVAHPDRFEDETTGLGYDVFQDLYAEDLRTWIDDEKVAVYVFSAPPHHNKDDEVPNNIAAQAFARFYERWGEEESLEATRRWLAIFREEKYDLAVKTIRGYVQGDWADVFAASIIDLADGTPGYGTAESHIDEYAMWRRGDVWTVSPDDGESLSNIYAGSPEEALEYYLEVYPPVTPDSPTTTPKHPEPDFVDDRIARWYIPDGSIVTDRLNTLTKVFFYQKNDQTHEIKDPDALVTAIRAAQNYTFDTKE